MYFFRRHDIRLKALVILSVGAIVVYINNLQLVPASSLMHRTLLAVKEYNGSRPTPELGRKLISPKDIEIPTDMWRHPSEIETWHPVRLPQCCAPEQTDVKRPALFKNFCTVREDDIRYYGPGMGYTPGDLKDSLARTNSDLIIIGDSVSHQWYKTLSCYLGCFEAGQNFHDKNLEVDITQSFLRYKPTWRTQGIGKGELSDAFNVPKEGRKTYTKQNIQFMHVRTLDMPDLVEILDYYNERYPHDFNREKPIFVINLGLHYNLFKSRDELVGQERVERWSKFDLKNHLKTLIIYCRNTGAKCIFRETSPQHFESSAGDGLFPGEEIADKCMKTAPTSFSTLSRWRNDVLYEAIGEVVARMEAKDNGGFTRVMPIFDKLVGLDINHHRTKVDMNEKLGTNKYVFDDCTHFSLEPNIWEPWHISLTEVLSEITGRGSAY